MTAGQRPSRREREDAIIGEHPAESGQHDGDGNDLQPRRVAPTHQLLELGQPPGEHAADQHPAERAQGADPEDDRRAGTVCPRGSAARRRSAPARAAMSSYMIEPTPAASRPKA